MLTKNEALEPTGSFIPGFCSTDEAARSISTPLGRDASPSQVIPLQFVRVSPKICRYTFYYPTLLRRV